MASEYMDILMLLDLLGPYFLFTASYLKIWHHRENVRFGILQPLETLAYFVCGAFWATSRPFWTVGKR